MKFMIRSYKRPTLISSHKALMKYGVTPEDILVSVQTKEDLKAYREVLDDGIQVVYGEGKTNCAGNRNILLDAMEIGERAIFLDDDITNFKKTEDVPGRDWGKTASIDAEEFQRMLDTGWKHADEVGAKTWGLTAAHNNLFMAGAIAKDGEFSKNVLLTGAFIALEKTQSRFNEDIILGEDAEYCLQEIAAGRRVFKYHRYSIARKGSERMLEGGSYEAYQNNSLDEQYQAIIDMYPELVKRSTRGVGFNLTKLGKEGPTVDSKKDEA